MNNPDYILYNNIISLFRDVKLMEGNLALNSSIRRHKSLALYVKNFQKRYVSDLESCVDSSTGLSFPQEVEKYCILK